MQIESLRQQPPFRYVDEILSINREKRTGQFGLNIMEGQHRYAYPQGLPGYLLVEAMAQSSGLLLRAVT
ncbi:MAG: hypothetical protein OEW08_06390, partial [Gammaproteobacteria bacterium]|nr:hypothetical protein [Gammaproteobacteria bacterium]